MGFCPCDDLEGEAWAALLGLARFPQVYVKASAFFRVSKEPPPYPDAAAALRRLLDVFGAQRCMWGTDAPWVNEQCGYSAAWGLLEAWGNVRDDEVGWLMGGTVDALFDGAWSKHSNNVLV